MTAEFERTVDELDLLLTAIGMHPMTYRQSFKILRLNLRDMKRDGLSPEIERLKRKFVALNDEELRRAWEELHNPFRHADEVRH